LRAAAGWGLTAIVLAACAHTPNLPLRPDPAPPAGSTTWTFKARDGTELLARTWAADPAPIAARGHNLGAMVTPETGPPKWGPRMPLPNAFGVVVIMHGLKDYSARYDAFAQLLSKHGYVVYGVRSARPRPLGGSARRAG